MPNPNARPDHAMPPEAMLMQMSMSYFPSRILSTALQFNVFSQIAAGHLTGEAIARASGATPRGMNMILDCLVSLQLLGKDNGAYRLTPISEQFLRRESADYLGAMMEDNSLWDIWAKLPEVIRSGKPLTRLESQAGAESFFPMLIRSLHIINREPARMLARALGIGSTHKGTRVLDVACGSAIWSIAVAEADRQAKPVAQDFPAVLEHTRGYLRRHEVSDRYELLAGDLKTVNFGEGRFDLALLGNIVHSEGERSSRDLFKRLHQALVPGGRIAIVDMIPNDERTGPPFPLFFSLMMLVNTEEGSTYTLAEYSRWLKDAGFSKIETVDIHSHSPVIVATR